MRPSNEGREGLEAPCRACYEGCQDLVGGVGHCRCTCGWALQGYLRLVTAGHFAVAQCRDILRLSAGILCGCAKRVPMNNMFFVQQQLRAPLFCVLSTLRVHPIGSPTW